MPLLVLCGHGMAFLGLGVPVEVLRIDQVPDLGHPGRADPTAEHHAPVHASEPLVRLYLLGAVLQQDKHTHRLS